MSGLLKVLNLKISHHWDFEKKRKTIKSRLVKREYGEGCLGAGGGGGFAGGDQDQDFADICIKIRTPTSTCIQLQAYS